MDNVFQFTGQWITWIESVAMLTGIAGVWLTIRQNPLCFPAGIINVGLYAWIFFSPSVRLYADAALQCIYIGLLFYGWYKWTRRHENVDKGHPSFMKRDEWIAVIIISAILIFISGAFLSVYTDADLPWTDSVLGILSLSAQWMIARKKIENWIVWIVVNIAYIPLYLYKNLPLTALLYFLFLILALKGLRSWAKEMKQPANA